MAYLNGKEVLFDAKAVTVVAPVVVDNALSDTSTNPVQNKVVKDALDDLTERVLEQGLDVADAVDGLEDRITTLENKPIDDHVSLLSENPVQNKVVSEHLQSLTYRLDNVDSAVLYTPQFPALTEEQKAQARENIGAVTAEECVELTTTTYNDGDVVGVSNVKDVVLHGGTKVYQSKNLCSLQNAEVVCDAWTGWKDFDIEEIPAGNYAFSANITTSATNTPAVLFLDAEGNTVKSITLTGLNGGRFRGIWLSVPKPFCKLRLFTGSDWNSSIRQTATYTDIQIEAGNENTAFEPYYKVVEGVPASVSFGDVTFSADAELTDGESISFGKGLLKQSDGTEVPIACEGDVASLSGTYELSAKGEVDIVTQPYVRCDPQALSEEQKAQARENIGAEPTFDASVWGLPVLQLTGDTSAMTKDNAVTLAYVYGDRSGTCTCKWQGSSSLSYPKKNYTIKFDEAFEAAEGWGEQKKYCFKANFIDHSHARNLVSAKLWGEIVKDRGTAPSNLTGLVNGGAVDGFPCIITLNGEFHGLYTFNIPKDGWMFGMGDGTQEAIICADKWVDATGFKAPAVVDGSDFELEYVSDEDDTAWVVTSLNRLINACINSDGTDLDTTIAQYVDLNSAIDYYIFTVLLAGQDMTCKNYILTTFDGTKWHFSAYDMDSTYGLYWNGRSFLHVGIGPTFDTYAEGHRLMELLVTHKKDAIVARYNQLRGWIMSEDHVAFQFGNFAAKIPTPVLMQDVKTWPTIPSSTVCNVTQIRDYYRLRVAYADKLIKNL